MSRATVSSEILIVPICTSIASILLSSCTLVSAAWPFSSKFAADHKMMLAVRPAAVITAEIVSAIDNRHSMNRPRVSTSETSNTRVDTRGISHNANIATNLVARS